jgi:hypothetical protein
MTRIERIYADYKPFFSFGFIRVNPFKSDLIRVPLSLIFLFGSGFAGLGYFLLVAAEPVAHRRYEPVSEIRLAP